MDVSTSRGKDPIKNRVPTDFYVLRGKNFPCGVISTTESGGSDS